MRYYPLFVDLRGKKTVVVGGGPVAERKVAHLLTCGARVTVISPHATRRLLRLARERKISYISRRYQRGDLRKAFLVFIATDDPSLNARAVRDAHDAGLLVNAADSLAGSTFLVPSVVARGDLQIAVTTGGASPALARWIRKELEKTFCPEYARFVRVLSRARRMLLSTVPQESQRRAIFRRLVESDLLHLLRAKKQALAEKRVREITGRSTRKQTFSTAC